MVYVVGLTGTIASGKSTVASLFKAFGVDIINADEVGKSLTQPGALALEKIVEHFGLEIIDHHGQLQRKKLRTIILNDPNERTWLENLLHPLIRLEITKAVQKSTSPYCVVEIPLLPDRLNYPFLNVIISVKANKEAQIKRIITRDKTNREEALKILNCQASDDAYEKIADMMLLNQGSMNTLKENIRKLHREFLVSAQLPS